MRPLEVAEMIAAAPGTAVVADGSDPFEGLSRREWLSTNGLGSFASGTVAGANARRYHALLVAALDPPARRMTLLSKVDELVTVNGERYDLSTNRYPHNTVFPDGWRYLAEFTAWPVPTWTYRLPGEAVLVKRVYLARGRNTVYVTYTLRESPAMATLTLTPLVCWKEYHAEMRPWQGFPLRHGPEVGGWSLKATEDSPTLRLRLRGAQWTAAGWWHENIVHDRERERGLDYCEDLYCPAVAQVALRVGQTVALTAGIEDGEPDDATFALAEIVKRQDALCARASEAGCGPEDENFQRDLILAADQFIVQAERTTILAGYPWFTDWGRDTMIALPGLCLTTGRYDEAREILRAFAGFLSAGMIPNRFPDAVGSPPDYNNADGTLWFVHACARYVEASGDTAFRGEMTPVLEEIVAAHTRGTRFGIRVDEADGLLLAGEPGENLTWMDAKIGDWVVTPRMGKPVEINALWLGALRALAEWTGRQEAREVADRAAASFRAGFVRPDGKGLYDVIAHDGTPDGVIRPNQVIAAVLPYSPLTPDEARAVLDIATSDLLTPYGLRSLSPHDSRYRPRYGGDPRSRDSAYHQGTVWAWLIGPYIDLYRMVHGTDADVRPLLAPLEAHLREYGVGGIAEVFDGDPPHRPDGCPWQAWSVAELLRVRVGGR
jgi:predicted glycogen debranching enzyme